MAANCSKIYPILSPYMSNYILLFDGVQNAGLYNLSTVYDFNLRTLSWTTAAAAPVDPTGAAPRPRTSFGAAVAVGRLVVFGGVDAQGGLSWCTVAPRKVRVHKTLLIWNHSRTRVQTQLSRQCCQRELEGYSPASIAYLIVAYKSRGAH
jgi:hypothetical protein